MAESTPFITIGIASFNYGKYLPKAFEAICRQSFRDFEVLYADDGSTDDSVAVIEKLIQDHPDMTIRLVQGRNGGVMANKNRILDNARGEYVMLCDADDWMDDDCLETLAAAAKRTGADRIVSEIRRVDPQGKTLNVLAMPENPSKWLEILHHGALYRRAVVVEHHICVVDRVPDDFCFITDFNIHAKTTEFVHKPVYNWVVHPDSTGSQGVWRGAQILTNVIAEARETIAQLGAESASADYQQLELASVKYYYYHLLRKGISCSFSEMMDLYGKMQKEITAGFPGYLHNRYLRACSDCPFRPSLHKVVRILRIAEETHLMKPLLFSLWLVNRVKPLTF